jgi:hypothetical protein
MRRYLYGTLVCLTIIAAIGLFLLLSGCAPKFESCWPGLDTCKNVKDRAYVKGTYTCLHKSRDYSQCLKEQGYESRVVIGSVRGYEREHAWVEVEEDGKVFWCEPTWDWGCWEASLWSDRTEN